MLPRLRNVLGRLERQEGPRVDQAEVAHLVERYHCEAGAEVAMGWSLPSEIVDACAAHHSVASAGDLDRRPHTRSFGAPSGTE